MNQIEFLKTQNIHITSNILNEYYAYKVQPEIHYWNGKEFTWSMSQTKYYIQEQQLITHILKHLTNQL